MRHFLGLLGIFKNESQIIGEWIEHYLWQGVDHFYLIDNGSDDGYKDILRPYIDKRLVTLYHMPGDAMQIIHYNEVLRIIRDQMRWLLICDIDEYMFGVQEPLDSYLRGLPETVEQVLSSWLIFGTNGFKEVPTSLRSSLIYRSEEKYPWTKAIVRPECIDRLKIHAHISKNAQYHIIVENNDIHLNHYRLVSRDYYDKIKSIRGLSTSCDEPKSSFFFDKYDRNEYKDLLLSNLLKYGYK